LVANQDFSKCELYDLVADPLEKVELSKVQPEVVETLVKAIRDWIQTLPTSPSGPVFSSLRADPVP
ncbi:MAG: N-acetylgalactosamine-6-sulfatase, partial [Verrucomicrobia bacterium]|nr:N-acetylgalactosamine-6-sulfatase [Verrucomicrobiota bacterium]